MCRHETKKDFVACTYLIVTRVDGQNLIVYWLLLNKFVPTVKEFLTKGKINEINLAIHIIF